jgi:hypothetical protein
MTQVNQTEQDALTNHSVWLTNFLSVYQKLSLDNLSLLNDIYHSKVTFIDPIQQVEGISDLTHYFEHLYQNLLFCRFDIDDVLLDSNKAAIYWTMSYQHKKLNANNTVYVQGSSLIKMLDGKVIYHRDYVDLGAMLYEQIPLVGKVIKAIKARASQ